MKTEKVKLINSLLFPSLFLVLIWIVKIVEQSYKISFAEYGIQPLKVEGLVGIITAPLIHADYSHLIANSSSLFLLSVALFYFYREIAYKVFFLIYFITNIWVWFLARDAYHIGASGLVYGFASFLFLSGIIRRHANLMALSLLIIFMYGGMVWGVFPHFFPQKDISWESHLMGLTAGIVLAVYFRKYGVQRKKYEWELEEENDDDSNDDSIDKTDVRFYYKEGENQ